MHTGKKQFRVCKCEIIISFFEFYFFRKRKVANNIKSNAIVFVFRILKVFCLHARTVARIKPALNRKIWTFICAFKSDLRHFLLASWFIISLRTVLPNAQNILILLLSTYRIQLLQQSEYRNTFSCFGFNMNSLCTLFGLANCKQQEIKTSHLKFEKMATTQWHSG